jgi:HlyD family secretion protein
MRPILRFPSCGTLVCLAATASLSIGCGSGDDPDAYGNFEATEVVVSAEANGQLLWFTADDGQRLAAGTLVGVIDTIQLALERARVTAERAATGSRANEVANQLEVLRAQHEIAQREYTRTQRLHGQQAATAQQLDQTERDYRVLGQQIEVTLAQGQTVRQDIASSAARVALIEDRIRRSRIANPRAGTVLASYVESGEFVQQGQPLYKIADLDSMDLRAYVTEPQLSGIRIGQPADISIDDASQRRLSVRGIVTWVSAEAEFTPTPIQTREERAELVYAVKIRVPNGEGRIKIGMPADVRFMAAESAKTASNSHE